MKLKIIILLLALTQVVIALDVSVIRKKVISFYEKDLKNVEKVLHYFKELPNDHDKVSGLRTLIQLMKEDDLAKTQEMITIAFRLRDLIEKAKDENNKGLLQKALDVKETLPYNIRSLTCTNVRFMRHGLPDSERPGGTYLYPHPTILKDKERRYVFADGRSENNRTLWRIDEHPSSVNCSMVYIMSHENEGLYPHSGSRHIYTWIPKILDDQQIWSLEIGTRFVLLRNVLYNQYLYVSTDQIEGNYILKTGSKPYEWRVFCLD